jgi:hypothetical protein
MKTAKVLKVTIDSWDWQYGKMYSHKMELDNWETIKLNKKKDNSFKIWDTVSYEENWDGKWKEVKEEKPYQPRTSNDNNVGAMIWMAMKLAFEHLYDKTNYTETYQLWVRIFEDSMALLENYWKNKSESKIEDSTENDDLPF